jgi:hypothetical protein
MTGDTVPRNIARILRMNFGMIIVVSPLSKSVYPVDGFTSPTSKTLNGARPARAEPVFRAADYRYLRPGALRVIS